MKLVQQLVVVVVHGGNDVAIEFDEDDALNEELNEERVGNVKPDEHGFDGDRSPTMFNV